MTRRHQRVSLESLRLLDAIDRHGSFAAAAQELCVVTSSITHAVRNLEENLGLTLFDRSGRSARFTTKGRSLLDSGRPLMERAAAFDAHVQLIATGWEPLLVLSLDEVIPMKPMVPLLRAFFEAAPQTSVQVRREAVAGSWDALMSGRADLVVGAPAGGPAGGGFECAPLWQLEFVLAAPPDHPLAGRSGSISNAEIAQYRAVVLGDTTRSLPHLSYGLLDNSLQLSMPDHGAKLEAILQRIGCGFLPRGMAQPHVDAGRLVLLQAETPLPPSQSTVAWRAGETGRALRWWIDHLTDPSWAQGVFA